MKVAMIFSIILVMGSLAGCIQEKQQVQEITEVSPAPERMSFSSSVMGDADNKSAFDLEKYVSDGPVLLIWVAAGCRGCHSWTDEINDEVSNGNISSSSVLSIHRYPSFESSEYVEEVYGENSTNPTLWTLALPSEDTPIVDLDSGLESDYSLYESFNNPSTPTLQIMDPSGKLIWSSSTYWPSDDVVDEIRNIIK